MELAKIKQRLELLYQEVEKLEREGGGGGGDDSYTKAQTDALLAEKADKSTTYTKTQVDNALSEKANAATTYTKDETNAEILGAITDLDVPATSATGHYIKSIGQADGKIEAVAELLDTAPAPSSTKPITSGAVYTDQQRQDTEIGSLVDRGAKNIYKVAAISSTNNNVTFTVYLDGTIGVKTTSAGASQSTFFFLSGYMVIQPGTYVLSGGISNSVMLYDGADTNPWKSTGEAAEKTFDAATNLRLCIRVNSGYTNTTEVIVKPMVCTKADYEASNAYVPYAITNRELYVGQASYTAESANGSFSSLLHSAATYCGVDDTQEVNGFVVFTSSVTSENLIGFFNFKYLRNVVFSPVISNTITYSAQSQYGTITITGGTGPYKAVVKFI